MDLDGDGRTDILSGAYSHPDAEGMAGFFQVLEGQEGGGFAKPRTLTGADGDPLVMDLPGGGEDEVLERICTRAWAVDLTGDGVLDIVSGNFGGTFGYFEGLADGGYASEAKPLVGPDGELLEVAHHSDPCFVDWDGDGDQDMISGSAAGGAFLFPNVGKDGVVTLGERVTLLEPDAGKQYDDDTEPVFGSAHFTAPASSTRVAAADVNGDGKLDLLVGDTNNYFVVKEGVDEARARQALKEYDEGMAKLIQKAPVITDYENMTEEQEDAMDAFSEAMQALEEARSEFVEQRSAGFVWLYARK